MHNVFCNCIYKDNDKLMIKLSSNKQARYLFLFAFCFVTTVALLFTKLLLPMLPALHGGYGLLKNDAVFFQQSALLLADSIVKHGWFTWSMWSTELNTTGNVGILSALYALFSSHDPALIIPINAFFHASSAFLLLLIGREIWPGKVGSVAGLVTAVLFVIYPSALSWYSQPLKDSYVIAGVLIVLYSLLKLLKPLSIKQSLMNLAWLVIGMCLVIFVKPYYIKLLLVIVIVTSLIIIVWAALNRMQLRKYIILFSVLAIGLTGLVYKLTPVSVNDGTIYEKSSLAITPDLLAKYEHDPVKLALLKSISTWRWKNTQYLPHFVDQYFETAARTRLGMIFWNLHVGANTLIDANRMPDSVTSSIAYLPRALQVGLFAPFPNMWLEKISLPRLGAVIETLIWYLIAPGILLTLFYRRSVQLTITLIFVLFFVAVFSFVSPNVGTLYRARYAFEFLMMLIGAGGWVIFVARQSRPKSIGFKPKVKNLEYELEVSASNVVADRKKGLVRSMVVISTVTLICSMGFFVRDFLMTRWFGLGTEMDSFILGAMLPMLLVAVFSIPAGTAIIPIYAEQYHQDPELAKRLLASWAFALSMLLAILAVALYLGLPKVFFLLNWHYTAQELSNIQDITNIYLPVLWLSGLVVLANSALTAVGKVIFPSIAQLIVPIVTLIALASFGTGFGVYPFAYAMLVGQLLNLVIVGCALQYYHLLPAGLSHWQSMYKHLPFRDYSFLLITALSIAALIPAANLMAANLTVGSVAIIGISTKVILLITGIIAIGINTVLLPYFSKLIAKLQHVEAKSDFSFLLLWVTMLSVPATLLLTFLVEPMLLILFSDSKLVDQELSTLTRVIQYGIIQLPFYACALVSSKYITAHKRTGMILLSALTGLIIAIVVGSALSKIIGVAGITFAMTVASAVSAAILVLYTNYLRHLSLADSLFIGFNWILYITLFLFLHFEIYVGLIITSIIYLIFIIGEWQVLIRESA